MSDWAENEVRIACQKKRQIEKKEILTTNADAMKAFDSLL